MIRTMWGKVPHSESLDVIGSLPRMENLGSIFFHAICDGPAFYD